MEFRLEEIARHIDCAFVGEGGRVIRGVATVLEAGPDEITFAAGEAWERRLSDCAAGAVILANEPDVPGLNYIVSPNPQYDFVRVVRLFNPERRRFDGISAQAAIDESAEIVEPTSIGAFVCIGAGSEVGARTVIHPGCIVSHDVTIGVDCTLHPNVVIENGVTIGDRTIIHSGTVIGADGYGYTRHENHHHKIPQIGSVRIGDDVEIGANVCIDRGTLGDTVIGNGVKIDNLVQVAHNVTVGDDALLIAQVGISGSCNIGRGVVLAGRAGLKDHVSVGDGAVVAAAAVVTHDIKPGEVVAGYPAVDIKTWRRSQVIVRNLPRVWPRILELIKEAGEDED
ncbi:MAG TPA: UDP-3-O-(3-hydroxymyristoyl)glucosamine N-acyltransferase [Acidobacteriota bacterium]|nr:UDP-3-O-(3-hydroxymyristoyl)glucosamine N-acyltransferase [Acidobacteriota bacterium]